MKRNSETPSDNSGSSDTNPQTFFSPSIRRKQFQKAKSLQERIWGESTPVGGFSLSTTSLLNSESVQALGPFSLKSGDSTPPRSDEISRSGFSSPRSSRNSAAGLSPTLLQGQFSSFARMSPGIFPDLPQVSSPPIIGDFIRPYVSGYNFSTSPKETSTSIQLFNTGSQIAKGIVSREEFQRDSPWNFASPNSRSPSPSFPSKNSQFAISSSQRDGSMEKSIPSEVKVETLLSRIQRAKSLRDVVDLIPEVTYEQRGSRLVQDGFISKSLPDKEKRDFFNAMLPNLAEICSNIFGNFVGQCIVEWAPPDIRTGPLSVFLETYGGELAVHAYGSRVIQKAFERLDCESLRPLVMKMSSEKLFLPLILDENGNHVIQKLLHLPWEPSELANLMLTISNNARQICEDQYGCRVIQKAFDMIPRKDFSTELTKIEENIVSWTADFIAHEYASYVLQKTLGLASQAELTRSAEQLKGRVLELIGSKFASNIIEVYIRRKNREGCEIIFSEIFEDKRTLLKVMDGQYSNYIVQSFIRYGFDDHKSIINEVVLENSEWIRRSKYAKFILRANNKSEGRSNRF